MAQIRLGDHIIRHVISLAAAGSFVQTQSRMAVIENENKNIKSTLTEMKIDIKADFAEIKELLRNPVRSWQLNFHGIGLSRGF